MIDDARPRVRALADYYERAEGLLERTVAANRKRHPKPLTHNKNSHVSLWLSCSDADAIIDGVGLKTPLFEE